MAEGCHLVGVGDVAEAELADVVGGGTDLGQVVFAVLGLCVVPCHLAPFEFDQLPAVGARQVVPALVASKEALPDSAFDHGGCRGHKGLGA